MSAADAPGTIDVETARTIRRIEGTVDKGFDAIERFLPWPVALVGGSAFLLKLVEDYFHIFSEPVGVGGSVALISIFTGIAGGMGNIYAPDALARTNRRDFQLAEFVFATISSIVAVVLALWATLPGGPFSIGTVLRGMQLEDVGVYFNIIPEEAT